MSTTDTSLQDNLSSMYAIRKPKYDENDAKIFVESNYGFKVESVDTLAGFDDQNFKICTRNHENSSETFTLKIINAVESSDEGIQ